MKLKFFAVLLFFLFTCFSGSLNAGDAPHVEVFSPQGAVKNIRQIRARFSDQMAPFGDPRVLVEPFDIKCAEKGTGRWADGKNWVYDFDRDVPAGVECEFDVSPGLKSLSGNEITGQRAFKFSTGGPKIKSSDPYQGSGYIDEEQVFILELDAEADEHSIITNAYFSIEGIYERVGVRILPEEDRTKIFKAVRRQRVSGPNVIALLAKRRFPEKARVSLVWGKGITSKSGIATGEDQILSFTARPPFTAQFHCERENEDAACLPVVAMRLVFSEAIPKKQAAKITLKGPGNSSWKAKFSGDDEDGNGNEVSYVVFSPPFPPDTDFKVELPSGFADGLGRKLSNADKFPLQVSTGGYPPLAKFPARFGILELNGSPVLPVTLRGIEPEVTAGILKAGEGPLEKVKGIFDALKGQIFRVAPGEEGQKAKEILSWLKKVSDYGDYKNDYKSIFDSAGALRVKKFAIPKPGGAKAFEVVGIPLKEPGFYVVEIESAVLGSALLGNNRSMHVPATALVTNLSVHFKWGRESSIVWVTTLDEGKPAGNVNVAVMDCAGNLLWEGRTGMSGLAYIQKLPSLEKVPYCQAGYIKSGLFITARKSDDMSFVFSSWDDGIEPWRFQLPEPEYNGALKAHSVFDRTLLRAGETVHMKHVIRRIVMSGFGVPASADLPPSLVIRHGGSDKEYAFPLKWDANGIAEMDWNIPKDANLGEYDVLMRDGANNKDYASQLNSGSFRVEEFRVPLMKAVIQPLSPELVAPSKITVDSSVQYLAGGGASGLRVKMRTRVKHKNLPAFEGFDDYAFANGVVKEGSVSTQGGSAYEEDFEGEMPSKEKEKFKLRSVDFVLDNAGTARTDIMDVPTINMPADILAELEFKDPNGETQTVSTRIPLWPAKLLAGAKTDSWAASKDSFKFHAAAVDTSGKPVAGAHVKVDIFRRKFYSHRKRLVGGFYAYENVMETKQIGRFCEGKTADNGILTCEGKSPVSGEVILQAGIVDNDGRETFANSSLWVANKGEWWFSANDSDRIDLLPEKKLYEQGETARFQVRMPFREATALVTVEREGVMDWYVKEISGKMPVIEVPVKGNYAPNVFVSVLAVRGRVGDVQPTAIVDLARPAYKLGIAGINVGWKAHELRVKVSTDKSLYRVREKAKVTVSVNTADGQAPPSGSEVALAAVDEGLLELLPNKSWNILGAMMGKRGYGVSTSTANMHVVGKRHYGKKALLQGGGGGKQSTRELFDTLLFWKGRVALNDKGEATAEVPLNDSITGWRIAAVASGGAGFFGTGSSSMQTSQDLMIYSGASPVVREGDRFKAAFTIRNATGRGMEVDVSGRVTELKEPLNTVTLALSPGEAKEISWDITAPAGVASLVYEVEASEKGGAVDKIKVSQRVAQAVPVRTFQATVAQVEKEFKTDVMRPEGAVQGRGGVAVSMRRTLSGGLSGVEEYMTMYPYTCLEQKVSKAVALGDNAMWKKLMAELPNYLDSYGFAKYFPSMTHGSDALTAYIISISHEAGMKVPDEVETLMATGLKRFVEGVVVINPVLRAADLSIRKITAVEALSRLNLMEPSLLASISIEPYLWPTSAVIDWLNILKRLKTLPEREARLKEAELILRARLYFSGATMVFSTEGSDNLWWLMRSPDENSLRLILSVMDMADWKDDMPRLISGALARQKRGAWDITTANAWGVLAMRKFSSAFEKTPVSGETSVALSKKTETIDWKEIRDKDSVMLAWPEGKEELSVKHNGGGRPWAIVRSLAAIPLKEALSAGYRIKKTITPVEQKTHGKWTAGDVARVRLEVEAAMGMAWVVVNDPIPAGSTILGSGLGRDSALLTTGEKNSGRAWITFEERSFEAFRSYYEYAPKGAFAVEYTMRLNQSGIFNLPGTRVEAMYSPEMLGELPSGRFEVGR